MTSCLLLKAPDRILAVSDGRLAVSETQKSFDTVEKIRRFTPSYQIPRVSMGRFSHMSTFTEHDCFVAYAGTYALVSQIIERFIKVVSGSLILSRGHGGTPQLACEFNRSSYFDDSYNFNADDYLKMAPIILVDELLYAANSVCAEWHKNNRRADCEFLLFGPEIDDGYFARKFSLDVQSIQRGDSPSFHITQIKNGEIASIGSSEVATAAVADDELQKGLLGWKADQMEIDVHNALAELDLGGEERISALELRPTAPADENWSSSKIQERFIALMDSAEDSFVGGNFTVASASQRSREFTTQTVTPSA